MPDASATVANTTFNSTRLSRERESEARDEEPGSNDSKKRVSFTSQNSLKSPELDMAEQFPNAAKSVRIPSSEENGIGKFKVEGSGWVGLRVWVG